METEQQNKVNLTRQFVHYYALESYGSETPEVLESPFPIRSSLALQKINEQRAAKKQPQFMGKILRVTYDLVGRRFYLPEVADSSLVDMGGKNQAMFDAVRIVVQNKYGKTSPFPANPPILAEPTTTLRLKKLSDYPSSWTFIKRAYGDLEIPNLPVIEANLEAMPLTSAKVKNIIGTRKGAYISDSSMGALEFLIKGQNNVEMSIHSQGTPFILIDISPKKGTSYNDREISLISAFKEFSSEIEKDTDEGGVLDSNQQYSLEISMYMGWSIEDICQALMTTSIVRSPESALNLGNHILAASDDLVAAGYRNPADRYYYYSYVCSKSFPRHLNRLRTFEILNDEGKEGTWVSFRSYLFLEDKLLNMYFGAKQNSSIIRGQMEPKLTAFCLNRGINDLAKGSPSAYWAVINSVRKEATDINPNVNADELKFQIMSLAENTFTRKRVSMYPQAKEMLSRVCRTLKTGFDDLEIVVGPWREVGPGFRAAFVDDEVAKEEKIPLEPIAGLKCYPPFILVDTEYAPNVPDRTNAIIHEYQHYLNKKLGLVDKNAPMYNMNEIHEEISSGKGYGRFIKEYLGHKDEELAHITQMKSLLALGMSVDEVVRFFMADQNGINKYEDIALAAKYNQLANIAADSLNLEDLLGPEENDYIVGEENDFRQKENGNPKVGNPQN